MWRGRRGGRDGHGLMLLLMLLRNIADLERKPPLTLGLIGLMGGVHIQKKLHPARFQRYSLCPDRVIARGDVSRVVVSAFLHVDDVHLYHNMISFLWKGYQLEHRFGWLRFALVIAYFVVLCHTLVVALAFAMDKVLGFHGYLRQCSIGFSGVLFALKVLLNHGSPTFTSVYGINVPTKYAAWLELVYIHLVMPRSSFIGHMCGILAGYVFVWTRSENAFIDPCAGFLEKLWTSRPAPVRSPQNFGSGTASRTRDPSPRRQETDEEMARRLQEEENRRATTGVRDRFEAYERHTQHEAPIPPTAPRQISADELRRRRMARFQN